MLVHVVSLLCVLGAQAMELHRVTPTTSADAHSAPIVHCLCSSVPDRTVCSWADPPQATPLHYIATYSERQKQPVTRPCVLIPPGAPHSQLNVTLPPSAHKLWHCHLPELKLLTNYILNVTAVYPGGSSSHLSTFMMEDIVKPDPPQAVQVSCQNSRTVQVKWDPPSTWAHIDIFPLKYELLYQWTSRGQLKFNHLGPFKRTSTPVSGLAVGRTYQFQVCAKDSLGLGHCSEWSAPVNITLPLHTHRV
ncbi:interleukin-27 subunit beta [Periophthalmus magnuspinnatus]|uniref:interleukin-27 subunit beta n=1 Tax=Periophthalmus magnuspinnatus TaxID=409849 RepID=UPI00145B4A63|nr:interleukin-27 subunit beta [Periophthalmus magnuspinnatus]